DPRLQEGFFRVAVSVGYKEQIKQDHMWKTKKQLEDKYGDEEAAELIEGKLLR
ncbi:unnamed protein product, partial [Prorocentrum cordatum]